MSGEIIKIDNKRKEKETKERDKKKNKSLFYTLPREFLALSFWIYTVTKIFIYDIDIFLTGTFFPSAAWVVKYKFFIMIGLIATIWLFTKNKYILAWFSYILFYPLIILFWKVPKLFFKTKNWIATLAFVNAFVAFFKSIKFNFIITALLLVSSFLIFVVSNKIIIWTSILTLLIILFIIFVYRFILIFKPSALYQVYSKTISKLFAGSRKMFSFDKEVKELSPERMNEAQLQKWSNNLQLAIVFNRGCYFLSSKLREYQKSKFNFIFYVINFLILAVVAILIFAVINVGLYKINHNYFALNTAPNFFQFFYYSVNTLFANGIPTISPASDVAQFFYIVEILFAFFLVGIFLTLVLSVRSDRDSSEIDRYIIEIKKQGQQVESFIKDEYRLSIKQAIKELERLKAGMIKIIYYLSEHIDRF